MRGHRRIIRAGGMQGAEAGSASVITPKSIFGNSLELWLRADQGITLNGGNVSAWADQSGKGDSNRNALQGTALNQPTYNASDAGYGGKPTLTFDGTNSFMSSGTWTNGVAQPFFFAAVGNDSGAAVSQTYAEGGSDGAGNNRTLLYNQGGAYSFFTGIGLVGGALSNAKRVLAGLANSPSGALYISAKTPVSSGDPGSAAPFKFLWLGQTFAATARLNGKLAEVILVSGAPSTANINAFLDYVGARYGIAIGA